MKMAAAIETALIGGILATQVVMCAPPADALGFSGQVRGVVQSVGTGEFTYKVGRVIRTWKGNKAENPKALIGQTVGLTPRRTNHKTGTGAPVELHTAFIKTLKAGEEITLEIYNPRGSEFHLLELTGPQRDRAKRGGSGGDEEAGDIAELKREVRRLREENARLRRELEQRRR